MTHEDVAANRRKAAQIAQDVLSGNLPLFEGCMALSSLSCSVGLDPDEEPFETFEAVESEIEHLPIGDVRQYWATDALAQKDKQIASADAAYRDHILEACREVIKLFGATA